MKTGLAIYAWINVDATAPTGYWVILCLKLRYFSYNVGIQVTPFECQLYQEENMDGTVVSIDDVPLEVRSEDERRRICNPGSPDFIIWYVYSRTLAH